MKNVAEASRAVSGGRVGSVSCVCVAVEMNSAVKQKLVKFIWQKRNNSYTAHAHASSVARGVGA